MKKNTVLWALFFILCMGVGFLHGVLPQGLSKSFFTRPKKIQVLITDEILFPLEIRQKLEEELQIKFSVIVTRDWDTIIANTVASPSADLIFLPSYWAKTLAQQNLLGDIAGSRKELQQRVAADFISPQDQENFFFLPFYWLKTHIFTPQNEEFQVFLKNKKETTLFLLADEDLLLKHFQTWKQEGLWDLVVQKKILTLQLDHLTEAKETTQAAGEFGIKDERDLHSHPNTSSLLVWGAVIPQNSEEKKTVLEILDTLTTIEHQEKSLLKTPFNTAFTAVTSDEIPLYRRSEAIRNLQLKDILILDSKDQDAKSKLKKDFNFTL